jgi:hypothetical protein
MSRVDRRAPSRSPTRPTAPNTRVILGHPRGVATGPSACRDEPVPVSDPVRVAVGRTPLCAG